MVSWFGSQNQAGYGLSVAPQNRWKDEDGAGHASRSSGLLQLKTSWASVSQSTLKTDGGAARMLHVALLHRSCGVEAEDERVDATGCIVLFYPNFTVFVVLDIRDILVFSLSL
jgi:hypothetical protein